MDVLKGSIDYESPKRFDVVHSSFQERDELMYTIRADENHVLFGNMDNELSHKREKCDDKRYFKCFYDSFLEREDRFYVSLQMDAIHKEYIERCLLTEYEEEEFCGICRVAGDIMGKAEWSRVRYVSLSLLEVEKINRRIINGSYFSMILEAVCTFEVLHRRTIMFADEPTARSAIMRAELPDWLESRKRQTTRESQEEADENETEKELRLAYFVWQQKQEHKVFLFEQSEQKERVDMERLERFHNGNIAQMFFKELKEARYNQLKYELRQRQLPTEVCRNILTSETTERSNILLLQRDHFCTLQAEEVKGYLWTKRNLMINERVAQQLGRT